MKDSNGMALENGNEQHSLYSESLSTTVDEVGENNEFIQFLQTHGLYHIHDSLIEHGFSTLNRVKWASRDDFICTGAFKVGDVVALCKATTDIGGVSAISSLPAEHLDLLVTKAILLATLVTAKAENQKWAPSVGDEDPPAEFTGRFGDQLAARPSVRRARLKSSAVFYGIAFLIEFGLGTFGAGIWAQLVNAFLLYSAWSFLCQARLKVCGHHGPYLMKGHSQICDPLKFCSEEDPSTKLDCAQPIEDLRYRVFVLRRARKLLWLLTLGCFIVVPLSCLLLGVVIGLIGGDPLTNSAPGVCDGIFPGLYTIKGCTSPRWEFVVGMVFYMLVCMVHANCVHDHLVRSPRKYPHVREALEYMKKHEGMPEGYNFPALPFITPLHSTVPELVLQTSYFTNCCRLGRYVRGSDYVAPSQQSLLQKEPQV